MNKRYIQAVIGMMSIAVIGVVWLQMDLINTAIKENEVKFDKDVFDALHAVVTRLEREEEFRLINYSYNGFVTSYYNLESEEGSTTHKTVPQNDELPASERLLAQLREDIFNEQCDCAKCVAERSEKYRSWLSFIQQQEGQRLPLAERVDKNRLHDILRQELMNRGITIDYKYGLLSSASNGFVIMDNRYVVDAEVPRETLPGYNNVYNAKYFVHVFPSELPEPPGRLMVHFPTKSGFVGRSLWPSLFGSFIFTGVIMFSFGYTIYVIYTQKKLSEMKTDFINNMTHEFKTPIATISLAADSISSPLISGNPDKVSRFANIIKQENKRMNSQVEKVLQMALIDRDEFSLNEGEVNIHEVIQQAITNFSLQVEQREGSITSMLEARQPTIKGDLTHIANVIHNLLDNANKYSPERPEITVLTKDRDKGLEITVQDKGMGMNKEARKHIFDKFYRVHTGDVHDVKGFGLGLSYVKAIVQAHKGTIEVKSEPGKGSSFTIVFPTLA